MKKQNEVIEVVRELQYSPEPTPKKVKSLVYDEESGEFRICDLGNEGENALIVTAMAESGFASASEELFARNRSLLEVDILREKTICCVGLGSVGSGICLAMAQSGVGKFNLIDYDTIEIGNLCRHAIAGVDDVKEKKTDVMEKAILSKNPEAKVQKHDFDITDDPVRLKTIVESSDIIFCCVDTNAPRFLCSSICVEASKVCIYGRALAPRACALDVLVQRPSGPCYSCLVSLQGGMMSDEITCRSQLPAYTDNPDDFVQVGLSVDIQPLVTQMCRLGLMELSRGLESGISALEDEIGEYPYFIFLNRREGRYSSWAPFANAKERPTILRWYGARMPQDDSCPVCGSMAELEIEL